MPLLLLGYGLPSLADDGLGRLFLTPEERQRLDRLRQEADNGQRPGMINGEVRRSDGHHVIWIDGRPHPGTGTPPSRPPFSPLPESPTSPRGRR